jgi:DNA-binding transcriptional LysR family regulator
MNIRHLRFFVALARERHHGRAAAACHVTQPTLSEAIRQLECELEVPLIDRNGRRYRGLTPQGDRVLEWAQRILADEEALTQALAEIRGDLAGELRLGVIPTALPITPILTSAFYRRHPQVTLRIISHTSVGIERGLQAGELDAGVTYTDNEPLHNVHAHPLYRERYMLLTPAGHHLDRTTSITWREAATLPLCLLTPDMQNRRIIDRLFFDGAAGTPRVAVETNSVLSLLAHVRSGKWSSVLPHTFLSLVGQNNASIEGVRIIPLVKPEAGQMVGLVVSERKPFAPVVRALLDVAKRSDASIAHLLEKPLPPNPA